MFEKFDPAARPRLILDRLHHDIVRACCLCNLIKTKSLAVNSRHLRICPVPCRLIQNNALATSKLRKSGGVCGYYCAKVPQL